MEDRSYFRRAHLVGMVLLLLATITLARLFHLQVIRHGHYELLANQEQLRKYEVQPDRGGIYMVDRGQKVPVVMNRTLKRVYADPRFIVNKQKAMQSIANVTGAKLQTYIKKLNTSSFYVVLETELEPAQAMKIEELELAGIGIQDEPHRAYPEGSLGAQVLGFVNNDGDGQYGIEEAFDGELSGVVGLLNATTDTKGIPIATSDNFQIPPRQGSDVVLTIDRNIQQKVENVLKDNMSKYGAPAASGIVLDPNNGAVLAMANYPTFNPAQFSETVDYSVFDNRVVSGAYEPGSVIKGFTMSAGLDSGAVTPNTTYQDRGEVRIGEWVIENAEGIPTGTYTMKDVIKKSINTGVVYVLQQLGGGQINLQGKQVLHRYLTDQYLFGQATGIELPSEASGVINPPSSSDVNYANMTFGQGMSATMLQVVSGYSALANGGTIYKPRIVDQVISPNGDVTKFGPEVRAKNVVSTKTINQLKKMFESVIEDTGDALIPGYRFGGKSGTAQIPNSAGGYFENRDIGSFVGMAPLGKPQFVVMVRIDEPQIGTFASAAARPMVGDIMRWLLEYKGVPPSS